MNGLRLPPRLAAVAEVVPQCRVLVDVGTERAVLPAFLLFEGRCQRAIGVERSANVLREAAAELDALGLRDMCELRLGDGLSVLEPGEVDVIVIAGIGGRLTVRLLERDLPRLRSRPLALVLQPMSEPELVRRWLETSGHRLGVAPLAERLVVDAGRYYHVLVAGDQTIAGTAPPSPEKRAEIAGRLGATAAGELGVYLLSAGDPLLAGYIGWRRASLEHLVQRAAAGGSPAGVRRAMSARRLERALARIENLLRDKSW
ncbi:MAG: class I SAM-dependent methyltransferase [Bacillota bacterium]|nr:class I SAM-dependent methyltransferase [Bacillota bacterium]